MRTSQTIGGAVIYIPTPLSLRGPMLKKKVGYPPNPPPTHTVLQSVCAGDVRTHPIELRRYFNCACRMIGQPSPRFLILIFGYLESQK